jgi:hypothetical protein
MVLLTHLKVGFKKRAGCRCDCDGYRPDTLGEDVDFTIPPMPVPSNSKLGFWAYQLSD